MALYVEHWRKNAEELCRYNSSLPFNFLYCRWFSPYCLSRVIFRHLFLNEILPSILYSLCVSNFLAWRNFLCFRRHNFSIIISAASLSIIQWQVYTTYIKHVSIKYYFDFIVTVYFYRFILQIHFTTMYSFPTYEYAAVAT